MCMWSEYSVHWCCSCSCLDGRKVNQTSLLFSSLFLFFSSPPRLPSLFLSHSVFYPPTFYFCSLSSRDGMQARSSGVDAEWWKKGGRKTKRRKRWGGWWLMVQIASLLHAPQSDPIYFLTINICIIQTSINLCREFKSRRTYIYIYLSYKKLAQIYTMNQWIKAFVWMNLEHISKPATKKTKKIQ